MIHSLRDIQTNRKGELTRMNVTRFNILMVLLVSIFFPFLNGCGGDDETELKDDSPQVLTVEKNKELTVVDKSQITGIEFAESWIVVSNRFEISIFDRQDQKKKKLKALLTGHPGIIESITLSADSENFFSLAVGCSDGTIRLWDVGEVRQAIEDKGKNGILRFTEHSQRYYQDIPEGSAGGVKALMFSPIVSPIESKFLASGGKNSGIKLWDITSETQFRETCEGHSNPVTALTFNGKFLASGSLNGEIRIWDPKTCNENKILPNHNREITSLVFLPHNEFLGNNGTFLASASRDSNIMFWDLNKDGPGAQDPVEKFIFEDDEEKEEFTALAFLKHSKLLVAGTEKGNIYCWNMDTTDPADSRSGPLKMHEASITVLASSTEGTILASGSSDGTFHILDEGEILNQKESDISQRLE